MALVKTAILLFDSQIGSTADPQKHNRLWYDHYFFHPSYGQAGYWITQTDGERVLHGQVFDWLPSGGSFPDLSKRRATAEWVIRAFEQNREVNFDGFDVVVVFLGIAKTMSSDGGSTGANSARRHHNAVVMRLGDSFDFVAHELGHALGLSHSFGTNPIPVVGDNPGGYGHPFCIMSARFYGGTAAAYAPPKPRDDAPEYSGLGPSLNGLTARANGWIDAHVMDLGQTAQADFTIRARQWLGRSQYASPQGVELLSPDGSNYVVDFYVPQGWDQAQPGPAVVLTQGRGGRAHTHYPTANSGTYLAHLRLPVTFGALGASLSGPGFRVHVLDYNATTREVRVRVRRGLGAVPEVGLDSRVDTLGSRQVSAGVTTWEQGEALCLTGAWSYEKIARSQQAVIEATYTLGAPGMLAQWTIEGIMLPHTAAPSSGTRTLTVTVSVAHPKFRTVHESRVISLEYDIEPLANGSRLKLRNRFEDESFKLRIEVTLSNSVGSGSAVTWVDFMGQEYVYERAFYEQRDACFQRFIDVGKRYRPYKVVPFPQLWEQVDPLRHDEVATWLDALADHWERGEMQLYEQGTQALARELGVPELGLRVLSAEEAHSPRRIQHEIAPPAPPDLATAVNAARKGRSSDGRRLAGYLLAGATGAALAIIWGRGRS
jgi:hypothetical protein